MRISDWSSDVCSSDLDLINLRTVRPIDYGAIIESVKRTNRLVIVEEAWPLASISSEIAYKVQRDAFDYLDAPVIRIASADVPLPYAPTLLRSAEHTSELQSLMRNSSSALCLKTQMRPTKDHT